MKRSIARVVIDRPTTVAASRLAVLFRWMDEYKM
jgi:hypothetical protein